MTLSICFPCACGEWLAVTYTGPAAAGEALTRMRARLLDEKALKEI